MNMVMIMMLMMAMMKVMVMVMMMMVMMMITPADRPRVPSGIGRCSFKAPRKEGEGGEYAVDAFNVDDDDGGDDDLDS